MGHPPPVLVLSLAVAVLGCGDGCGSSAQPEADTGNETDSQSLFDAGISWISIEPGDFDMGSPLDEWGRRLDERLHHVDLIHSYEIASTEVTRAQWQTLEIGLEGNEITGCSGGDCPVVGESVAAIRGWLDELSKRSGLEPCFASSTDLPTPYHCEGYRLPTEAEWEYAARAGVQSATYAGDLSEETWSDVLADIGNCANGVVSSVGSFQSNDFGLFDVLGNVAELTDWNGTYPVGPVENPHGDLKSEHVGLRGGSYAGWREDCRTASRNNYLIDPDSFPAGTGFRLVRTLPDSALPDGAADASPCPGPVAYSCAGQDPEMLPTLLEASSIGEDATFTAGDYLASTMVLVGEATFGYETAPFVSLITVESVQTPDKIAWIAMGSAGQSAIDVMAWADQETYDDRGVALLCEDESCHLATPSLDNTILEPVPAGDVPVGIDPVALDGSRDELYPIIVVGDGIASFDGVDWHEAIAPGSGGRFVDVNYLHQWATVHAVAVGEDGRAAALLDTGWIEVDTNTAASLVSVDIWDYGERIFMGGEGGELLFGTVDSLTVCDLDVGAVMSIFVPPEYDDDASFLAGLETGQTVELMPEKLAIPICFDMPAPGPALEVAWDFHKAWYLTKVVLTPNGLHGYLE